MIDSQSLVKTRKTNECVKNFLDNERFYFCRIISKYKGNFFQFEDSWKRIVKKSSASIIKELALDVQMFFDRKPSLRNPKQRPKQWHPLQIAAECGNLHLCIKIRYELKKYDYFLLLERLNTIQIQDIQILEKPKNLKA